MGFLLAYAYLGVTFISFFLNSVLVTNYTVFGGKELSN